MKKYYEIFRLIYGSKVDYTYIQNLLLMNELELKKENIELYDFLLLAKDIKNVRKKIQKYNSEYKKWLFERLCEEIILEETERIYDLLYELVIIFGENILTNDLRYIYSYLDNIPLEKNKRNWNLVEYEEKRKKVLSVKEEIKKEIKKCIDKYYF